jgi:SAUR family protein
MATAAKRVDKIRQIVRLKQVVQRWKHMSLRFKTDPSYSSDSGTNRRPSPGYLAVYVGQERNRFVIPTRFLNLPVFVGLLERAEEEFGYQGNGGLVLPCEAGFFAEVLKILERDEGRFGRFGLEEFLKMVSELGFVSCREATSYAYMVSTPLLQKARV